MLKKQPVLLTLLLSLFSLGIYMPVWFLRRREGFNRLGSSQQLKSAPLLAVLAISCGEALLDLLELTGLHSTTLNALLVNQLLLQVVSLLAMGVLTIESFKLRRILQEAYGVHLDPLLLLLFSIFYLQHWINHLADRPILTRHSA